MQPLVGGLSTRPFKTQASWAKPEGSEPSPFEWRRFVDFQSTRLGFNTRRAELADIPSYEHLVMKRT